jgi:phosphoribosylamine---glycine ligase
LSSTNDNAETLNVLVVGSGGREHALCWALRSSPRVGNLYCTPGNGGIAKVARRANLDATDTEGVRLMCRDLNIGFVVVGPEAPLVDGMVDELDAAGVPAFGPSAAAAQLEGSKAFTKDLCSRYNIPTAAYGHFDNGDDAKAYVRAQGAPIVVKADGLAAGKGVTIAQTEDDALLAIDKIFDGQFGDAGNEVVIEEFLEGEEASFFVLVDGEHTLELETAQDHKAVGDGDTGPNTGGMGAYSPAPVMTAALRKQAMDEIITPTVAGMAADGAPYKGVLYAGLMITDSGPKLIEYNARFGDPECQVLMARLDCDLLPLLMASQDGTLDQVEAKWKPEVALSVVMASKGYPGPYEKDTLIRNLDMADKVEQVTVFHAGTALDGNKFRATGGRVLNVTALGRTVAEAQTRAYEAVDSINWPSGFCRRDIGWRAIERENTDSA